jgi:hypothetical protein
MNDDNISKLDKVKLIGYTAKDMLTILLIDLNALVDKFGIEFIKESCSLQDFLNDSDFNINNLSNYFTINELANSSISLTELKNVYSLNLLKYVKQNNGSLTFTINDFINVGFTPVDFINNNYTFDEIKELNFNILLLKQAGITAEQLHTVKDSSNNNVYTLKDMIEAGYTAREIRNIKVSNIPYYSAQSIVNTINSNNLNITGFDSYSLRMAGYILQDLIDAGFSYSNLFNVAKFSIRNLLMFINNPIELIDETFTTELIIDTIKSIKEIKISSVSELINYELEIRQVSLSDYNNMTLQDRQNIIKFCNVNNLSYVYSIEDIYKAGLKFEELLNVYTSKEIVNKLVKYIYGLLNTYYIKLNITEPSLNSSPLTITNFINNNINLSELVNYFKVSILKNSGFTGTDFYILNYSVNLLKDDFTALELKNSGYSLLSLINAKYSVKNLKNAEYTAGELKDYFTPIQLKNGGYLPGDLLPLGYNLQMLIELNYTVSELKPYYQLSELFRWLKFDKKSFPEIINYNTNVIYYNGFEGKQFKQAGYTIDQIVDQNLAFQLNETEKFNFSADILVGWGYTAEDFVKSNKQDIYSPKQYIRKFTCSDFINIKDSNGNNLFPGNSLVAKDSSGNIILDENNNNISLLDYLIDEHGFSAKDLFDGGWPRSELFTKFGLSTLLEELGPKNRFFNYEDYRQYNVDPLQLRNYNYSVSEMFYMGYSIQQIFNTDTNMSIFEWSELVRENQVTLANLKQNTTFTANEIYLLLKRLYETNTDVQHMQKLKQAGYSFIDIVNIDSNNDSLLNQVFTLAEISNSNPKLPASFVRKILPGYTSDNFLDNGWTLKEIITFEFEIVKQGLDIARFSIASLIDAAYFNEGNFVGRFFEPERQKQYIYDKLLELYFGANGIISDDYYLNPSSQLYRNKYGVLKFFIIDFYEFLRPSLLSQETDYTYPPVFKEYMQSFKIPDRIISTTKAVNGQPVTTNTVYPGFTFSKDLIDIVYIIYKYDVSEVSIANKNKIMDYFNYTKKPIDFLALLLDRGYVDADFCKSIYGSNPKIYLDNYWNLQQCKKLGFSARLIIASIGRRFAVSTYRLVGYTLDNILIDDPSDNLTYSQKQFIKYTFSTEALRSGVTYKNPTKELSSKPVLKLTILYNNFYNLKIPFNVTSRYKRENKQSKTEFNGIRGTGYTYNEFINSQTYLSKNTKDRIIMLLDAGFSIREIYSNQTTNFSLKQIANTKYICGNDLKIEGFSVRAARAVGYSFYYLYNYTGYTVSDYRNTYGNDFFGTWYGLSLISFCYNELFNLLLNVRGELISKWPIKIAITVPKYSTPIDFLIYTLKELAKFTAKQLVLWFLAGRNIAKVDGITYEFPNSNGVANSDLVYGDYLRSSSYPYDVLVGKENSRTLGTNDKITEYYTQPIIKTEYDLVVNTVNNFDTETTKSQAKSLTLIPDTESKYKNPDLDELSESNLSSPPVGNEFDTIEVPNQPIPEGTATVDFKKPNEQEELNNLKNIQNNVLVES